MAAAAATATASTSTTAAEAPQTHGVARWPVADVRAALPTLAAKRAAAAAAPAAASAAAFAAASAAASAAAATPLRASQGGVEASPFAVRTSNRDPALRVPHSFRHRGCRHLDVRAKACTRALHSFRVVIPIARSADGRNEATRSFPPDPHVTAYFGFIGAPVERAPPGPSPSRFLRGAEP
jgi:hypothetical protein